MHKELEEKGQVAVIVYPDGITQAVSLIHPCSECASASWRSW